MTPARGGNARKTLAASLVTLASAGLYGLVRVGAPGVQAFIMFGGACERLKASGLPVTAADWFCNTSTLRPRTAFVGGSLLVWLALVLPCAILAATGRRFTALLPMLVAPWTVGTASGFFFGSTQIDWFGIRDWWGTRYWDGHHVIAVLLNFLLIAAPVLAVGIAWGRGREKPGEHPKVWAGLLACVPPVLLTWGILTVARESLARHFDFGGPPALGPWAPFLVPALQIAVFSALLGPNRRWWPWSLGPVAFFLSSGPLGIVAAWGYGRHWVVWTEFGLVVPMFLVALAWSGWRPLALRFSGGREAAAYVPRPPSRRRVRPVVVLNAAAVALLAISAIAYRADPMPIQIGEPLPTYLGYRDRVNDVRARMNLDMAITTAGRYRQENGTWKGFDANTAATLQDQLAWVDLGNPQGGSSTATLKAEIVGGSSGAATIVTRSGSGTWFCIRRTVDSGVTWGDGKSVGEAIAGCGSKPWTPREIRPMPQLDCPADEDSGYLICRMVQVLAVNIMKSSNPP